MTKPTENSIEPGLARQIGLAGGIALVIVALAFFMGQGSKKSRPDDEK